MADNRIPNADSGAPMRPPVDMSSQVPNMSDAQLKVLRANVERLQDSGSPMQMNEAKRLLPVILAEMEARKPAPAETTKRAPAKKKAAAKPKAKAKAAAE
jgi:hypothetical protein